MTLKIDIDVCEVHVKLRKPIRVANVYWPVLSINKWVEYLLSHKPQLLLAGHALNGNWRGVFNMFWEKYQQIDPQHPIYQSDYDRSACVPYYIHGDEGRGHLRRPYMVISWQCVVAHHGVDVVNDTSFLVRNLGRKIHCSWGTLGHLLMVIHPFLRGTPF